MQTVRSHLTQACHFATALLCLMITAISFAQPASTGTIVGRVQDRVAGLALEKARVTVEGSNREAFTDEFGEFRLTDLPAGSTTVRVFYTGRAPQSATINVAASGVARQDFALGAFGTTDAQVVTLDNFVVAAARETNAAAIAINEQRFAASTKNVVSTDAMGIVGENNIGEFVKFLPGIDVVTDQMNAVAIQLRGMPQA